MKQKEMLELAMKAIEENEKHIKNKEWNKVNSSGIHWGGTKEYGKLYHAYCVFQLREGFPHPGKNDGFFEECIQTSKEENAKEARKKGWVIGRGEFKDIAICPSCVNILKNK